MRKPMRWGPAAAVRCQPSPADCRIGEWEDSLRRTVGAIALMTRPGLFAICLEAASTPDTVSEDQATGWQSNTAVQVWRASSLLSCLRTARACASSRSCRTWMLVRSAGLRTEIQPWEA